MLRQKNLQRPVFRYLNFLLDNVEETLQNVAVDDVQNTEENITIQVAIKRQELIGNVTVEIVSLPRTKFRFHRIIDQSSHFNFQLSKYKISISEFF